MDSTHGDDNEKKTAQGIDRRDFLRQSLVVGAGLIGATAIGCRADSPQEAPSTAPQQGPQSSQRSRVIHPNSPNAFDLESGQANYQVVKTMVDTGICHVTGEPSSVQAWQRIVGPDDRVGIKINCLGRPAFVNNTTLLRVLKEELVAAGVAAQNIIIFDRYASHLTGGGFTIGQQSDGTWLKATDGGGPGYDPKVSQSFAPASGGSQESAPLTKIVTQQITKLINVPIIKNHGGSGVTLALKNYAFGCFQHTGSAHDNNGDPYTPAMCSNPVIRSKTVLTILDGLKAQYEAGPGGNPQFQWAQNSILMGTDMVAIDFLGAGLINQARQNNGKGPISNSKISHIFTAAQMGLGRADEAQIEEVTIPV